MTSDLRSLLAAIVADPGDDTARLAYADCLDEHGNSARAAFIRAQVEADRLHPHANARAALEARAQVLFEQHWIEWWGEVCEAVDLPPPAPKPLGRLARLVRRVAAQNPYEVNESPTVRQRFDQHARRAGPFYSTMFRRGFPDLLSLLGSDGPAGRDLATRWAGAAPLDVLLGTLPALGAPGPHLRTLRSLSAHGGTLLDLRAWLHSPHLPRLESLSVGPQPGYNPTAWADLFAAPAAARLRRLQLPAAGPGVAAAVARQLKGTALRELELVLREEPAEAVAAFARHAGRLEELILSERITLDAVRPLSHGWPALRKLDVWAFESGVAPPDGFGCRVLGRPVLEAILSADLPALEELHLSGLTLDDATLDALESATLLRQLRHIYLHVRRDRSAPGAEPERLARVIDGGRVETLLVAGDCPGRAADALRAKFGDKLRLLT